MPHRTSNIKPQSTFCHYIPDPDPKDCPCPPSRQLKTRVGTPPTSSRCREAEEKILLYPKLRPKSNCEAYRDYYGDLSNLYQQFVEKKRTPRKKKNQTFKLSSDVTLRYLQNCSQSCAQRFIKKICACEKVFKQQKPPKPEKECHPKPKRTPRQCVCTSTEAQTSLSCLYVEPCYNKDSDSSNLSSSVDEITPDPSCVSRSCTRSVSCISRSRTCSKPSCITLSQKPTKSSNKICKSVVSLGKKICFKKPKKKRRVCSVCPPDVMCTSDACTQAAVKQRSCILKADCSCGEERKPASQCSRMKISCSCYVYLQNLWVPCFAICLNVLFFYYFFETFPSC